MNIVTSTYIRDSEIKSVLRSDLINNCPYKIILGLRSRRSKVCEVKFSIGIREDDLFFETFCVINRR